MSDGTEQWRAVIGFVGFYEVSDHGRVRSVAREVRWGASGRRVLPSMSMRPAGFRNGYPGVSLTRDGRQFSRYVHLLVAEAFLGPRPSPDLDCCHGDGDPWNARVENLRWDTKSSNALDKIQHGTMPQLRNAACPQGHLYSGANLYRWKGNRARGCQACRDAHNERQRQPADFDWRAFADARYAQLTDAA